MRRRNTFCSRSMLGSNNWVRTLLHVRPVGRLVVTLDHRCGPRGKNDPGCLHFIEPRRYRCTFLLIPLDIHPLICSNHLHLLLITASDYSISTPYSLTGRQQKRRRGLLFEPHDDERRLHSQRVIDTGTGNLLHYISS